MIFLNQRFQKFIFILFFSLSLGSNLSWAQSSSELGPNFGTFASSGGVGLGGNTGAVTTSIPIEIPPGSNGLTPQLSLTYNSQNTVNGPYGYGWSLNIGTIERQGPRGEAPLNSSVSMTDNRFVLNLFGQGGELVSDGGDGQACFLSTRQQSFLRVKTQPDNCTSFNEWHVFDRAGNDYRFSQFPLGSSGRNTQYFHEVFSPTGAIIWANYEGGGFADIDGDGIDEIGHYDPVLPHIIGYHAPNTQPYYFVDFIWQDRPDPVIYSSGGRLYYLTKRLQTITVWASSEGTGKKIRQYNFYYDESWDSGRSLLSSVELQKIDTNPELNSMYVRFTYTSNKDVYAVWDEYESFPEATEDKIQDFVAKVAEDFGTHTDKDTGVMLIDFDRDNLPDQLWHYWLKHCIVVEGDIGCPPSPYESVAGRKMNEGRWQNWTPVPIGDMGWFIAYFHFDDNDFLPLSTYPAFAQFGDLDGNGVPEIFRQHSSWLGEDPLYDGSVSNGVTELDGSPWPDSIPLPMISTSGGSDNAGYFASTSLGVIMVDINGDGLTDSLESSYNSHANPEEEKEFRIRDNGPTASRYSFDWLEQSDIIGDYTPPVTFYEAKDTSYGHIYIHDDKGVRLADLNADGLPDLIGGGEGAVYFDGWSEDWEDWDSRGIWFNTGIGWDYNIFDLSKWYRQGPEWPPDENITPAFIIDDNGVLLDNGWYIVDINGDKLTDITRSVTTYNQNTGQYVPDVQTYLNHGGLKWIRVDTDTDIDGWDLPFYAKTNEGSIDRLPRPYRLSDIDGNGLVDVIYAGEENEDKIWFNKLQTPDLLQSVVQPLGETTTITYQAPVFPHQTQPGVLIVPKEIKTQTRVDPVSFERDPGEVIQKFIFSQPVSTPDNALDNDDLWRRGPQFMGFRNVVEVITTPDEPQERVKVTHYFPEDGDLESPFYGEDLVGKVKQTEVYEDSKRCERVEYTYKANPDSINPPFYRPVIIEKRTVYDPCGENERSVTTQVEYDYDICGNQTLIDNQGNIGLNGDESQEVKLFSCGQNQPVPGSIQDRVIADTLYARPVEDSSEEFVQRWAATYYYDELGWGSVNKGLLTHAHKVDSLGFSPDEDTYYTYDDTYGNLETKTSPLGETTTWTYDPVLHILPKSEQTSLGTTTYTYYGIDIPILPEAWQPFGAIARIDRSDGTWAEYSYDGLGRVTEVKESSGAITQYSLETDNGLSIFVIKQLESSEGGGLWREYRTYLDRKGRPIRTLAPSDHPSGAPILVMTDYWHRGLERKVSQPVIAPENAVWIEKTYDALGRVKKIDAPMGSSTIQYLGSYSDINGVSAWRTHKKEIDDYGHEIEYVLNVTGQPVRLTTVLGTQALYDYDGLGLLGKIVDESNPGVNNQTLINYDGFGRKVSMSDPDSGTWSWTYNSIGKVLTQTDAKGQTIQYLYDTLGREIQQRPLGVPEILFLYDGSQVGYAPRPARGELAAPKGRMTGMEDRTGKTTWYYNSLGQLARESRVFFGESFETSFQYDLLGRLTKIKYPSQIKKNARPLEVSYAYNKQGTVSAVPGWLNLITYNFRGQAESLTFQNGFNRINTWDDATGRIEELSLQNRVQSLQDYDYTYCLPGSSGHGELCGIISPEETKTYTYDDMHRLEGFSSTLGESESYVYDTMGNLIEKDGASLIYSDALHPHAVKRWRTLGYHYDGNGDVISIYNTEFAQETTVVYSPYRKALVINHPDGKTTKFVYDGFGKRARKETPDQKNQYYVNPYFEKIVQGNRVTYAAYVWLNGERVGIWSNRKGPSGTIEEQWFLHGNHQASIEFVTNKTGSVVSETKYSPWGEILEGGGPLFSSLSYLYTGQEYDSSSGFYDYEGRMYDARLGRFLQADTQIPNPYDLLSLDRYAYARNNPVHFIDPSGEGFWSSLFGAFLKGFIGAMVTLGTGNPILGGMVGGFIGGAVSSAINGDGVGMILANAGLGLATGAVMAGLGEGFSALSPSAEPLAKSPFSMLDFVGKELVMNWSTATLSAGVIPSLMKDLEGAEAGLITLGAIGVVGYATYAVIGEKWGSLIDMAGFGVKQGVGQALGYAKEQILPTRDNTRLSSGNPAAVVNTTVAQSSGNIGMPAANGSSLGNSPGLSLSHSMNSAGGPAGAFGSDESSWYGHIFGSSISP